jgi:hypothetical protein
MTYNKISAALIITCSVAFTLASNETFGASVGEHGERSASTHSTFHRSVAQWQHHRRRSHTAGLLPAVGGYYYGPPNGEPDVVIREQKIYDDHYTCTLDMPWDWVHRCPSPSERPPTPVVAVPSVPGCAAQRVTVPMGDGKEQTVIINRC